MSALGYKVEIPINGNKPPKLWPKKDVTYLNGICVWNDDRTLKDIYYFPSIHESISLFKHATLGKGQLGVRSNAKIGKGVILGYYGCESYNRNCHVMPEEDNAYIMDPNNGLPLNFDALCMRNELGMINDLRGIADRPNVQMGQSVELFHHDGIVVRPIETVCEIEQGEELVMDYGIEYWKAREVNTDYRECTGKCKRFLKLEQGFGVCGAGYFKICKDCRGMEMRECSDCHKTFDLNTDNFYRLPKSEKYRTKCKMCHNAKRRKEEVRECQSCHEVFDLNSDNYYGYGVGKFYKKCKSCHGKKTKKKVEEEEIDRPIRKRNRSVERKEQSSSLSTPIGTLQELCMDTIDPNSYRTSFIPVTVLDSTTVGTYINGEPVTWKDVSSDALFAPRGPEMVKIFAPMDKVQVLDNRGIWWNCTIVTVVQDGSYGVMWAASFDGLSSISIVPRSNVRSVGTK